MYSTYKSVIELVPLLDNLDKNIISSFILKAGFLVNNCINDLYKVPIDKKERNKGKVSIISNSNILTGINTEFTNIDNIYLYLPDRKKTIRVMNIIDDYICELDDNVNITYSNQEYFVLPEWIVISTEFIAVNLLLNREFSRKGYNQEGIQKYKDDYNKLSNEYMYKLKNGVYYDSSLIPCQSNNNLGRLVYSDKNNISSEISSNIDMEIKNIYDRL